MAAVHGKREPRRSPRDAHLANRGAEEICAPTVAAGAVCSGTIVACRPCNGRGYDAVGSGAWQRFLGRAEACYDGCAWRRGCGSGCLAQIPDRCRPRRRRSEPTQDARR